VKFVQPYVEKLSTEKKAATFFNEQCAAHFTSKFVTNSQGSQRHYRRVPAFIGANIARVCESYRISRLIQ
jgi:hypothetical protein